MAITRKAIRSTGVLAGALGLTLAAAGCAGGAPAGGSDQTDGVTITVAWMTPAPPKATLDAFKEESGITVKWVTQDWDSLQTKIAAAATSNTYFADVTDVDWSRVGQLGKLGWFYPMSDYLDVDSMEADMPQLPSFKSDGTVYAIPFDSSIMVTTVNTALFEEAGITEMPTTMDEYTEDLRKIKEEGVVDTPLNIPFAAAEGLSTYWYQMTSAFGGSVLDEDGQPQFASPDSAGYQAAEWMVGALEDGLVPEGNINVTDSQGMQNLMAKGVVASIASDYSGNVGSLYDVPDSSTVVDQVKYIPTPGVDGPAPNLGNPDGIGIPKQAKYPKAAAEFIEWATSTEIQAEFAGGAGPEKVLPTYPTPSRLSAMEQITESGSLVQGEQLTELLAASAPVFPGGAPSWYPEFSRAVNTNLHAAAVGEKSVAEAIEEIATTAEGLAKGAS